MLSPITLEEYRACREQGASRLPDLDVKSPPSPRSVSEMVGSGFSRYVRLLHPFTLHPIRWRSRTDTQSPLYSTTRAVDLRGADDASLPVTGMLDVATSRVLSRVLFAAAANCDVVVAFDAREGLPALHASQQSATAHTVMDRSVYLLRDEVHMVPYLMSRSPLFMWPVSGAWHFAAELDGYSTYLGCDDAVADELLATSSLEVLDLHPDDECVESNSAL